MAPELFSILCLNLALLLLLRRRRMRRRRIWIRPIFRRRRQQGAYYNLVRELRLGDSESHFRYFRMSKATFDELKTKVGPFVRRRGYQSEATLGISPGERLAITLRYLATGNSQISLSFNYRVGRSTVCEIVKETSAVLWECLSKDYVQVPSTEQDWLAIGKQFGDRWNFPNCVGAIDGKHVVIQAPAGAGSQYYNYKGSHSIVLLAVCDAYYRFLIIDIGDSGRQSDGGVLSNSLFGQALQSNSLGLPSPIPLPGVETLAPFNLPQSQAVFNYRLSRARRIIENSFGILAARWRIFRKPIIATAENVVLYTKAAIALHNYLRVKESSSYCPPRFADSEDASGHIIAGQWRRDEVSSSNGLERIGQVGGNRYTGTASETRDIYKDYFNSAAGEVAWQYDHVNRTDY